MIFFKGLNELRGIASMAVVFHHIELFKNREGVSSLYNTPLRLFVGSMGKNGVYLFFVLSGFLITYLLLHEINSRGKVDTLKFYLRRIFRIWPVYYLLVLISFFVLPYLVTEIGLFGDNYYVRLIYRLNDNYAIKLILFLLFLPNLALVSFAPVAAASQSWSVGVEEQFYLIWPLLLNAFKLSILSILIAVIVLKFVLLYGFIFLNGYLQLVYLKLIVSFLKSFNIELMALGGIGAFFLFKGNLEKYLIRIKKVHVVMLVVVIGIFMLLNINYFIISLLYLILIISNTREQSNVVSNAPLNFLGNISYGIYMFHPLAMFVSYSVAHALFAKEEILNFNLTFYAATVGLTIFISFLSFRYFESIFIRQKVKFQVLKTDKELQRQSS